MRYGRLLAVLVAAAVVGGLLVADFNPSGTRTFRALAGEGSAAIRPLVPQNRVEVGPDGTATVKAEPVYLDVRVPSHYDTLTLSLEIDNRDETLLEAGLAMGGAGEWQYYLQPLQHRQLDQLAWPKVTDGELTLWQKYGRYKSVADFLADSQQGSRVATFNYSLDRPFSIPGYADPPQPLALDATLRGPVEMAVYLAATGTLQMSFDLQDNNRTPGPDPVAFVVRSAAGRVVHTDLLPDDGRTGDRVGASPRRTVDLAVPNLAQGVYFVELRMNQDLFLRKITSRHHKLAFRERLYLADSAEYADGFTDLLPAPPTVFSNGRRFLFRTAHPAGYQTVSVNGVGAAQLAARHREYYASSSTPVSTIRSPRGDLQIETDGWLAFGSSQLFNPTAYTVRSVAQLTSFDYLLARYTPISGSGWRTATATFNLAAAARTDGRVRLLISGAEPTAGEGSLGIRNVSVTLSRGQSSRPVPALLRWARSWLP